MPTYMTTAEVAAERGISTDTVLRVAKRLNIGERWGRRAGYRFTEADMEAISAAMRPAPPVQRRRRRRSA
jgi:hypothetical protein